MEKVIVLSKVHQSWAASFYNDGEPDQKTIDLFGQNLVPTAFDSSANQDVVIDAIQKHNPEHTIYVLSRAPEYFG